MPESGFPGCTKHPERDQSLHLQGPCPGLLLVILNPRTLLPMFSSWHPAQPAPPSGHEVQTPHPTPTLLQLSLGPCWSHIPRLTALLPHALLLTNQVWVSPNCEPLQGRGTDIIPPPHPPQHSTLNKYLQLVQKKKKGVLVCELSSWISLFLMAPCRFLPFFLFLTWREYNFSISTHFINTLTNGFSAAVLTPSRGICHLGSDCVQPFRP